MKYSSHQEKSEISDRLLNELDIRQGLRGKLFYLYPGTFQTIHSVFNQAEDFDWLIKMHTIQASEIRNQGGIIYFDKDLSSNAQLILQEVIDDYWACCHCFQSGFTKQAEGILRSTVELVVQLYYLRYLDESKSLGADSWALGSRGVEKLRDRIAAIKKMKSLDSRNYASQLEGLYNRLCTSTHSRKDRLTAMNLPRSERAKDMPSFEPLEILYTKALFCSVVNLELEMIQEYFQKEPKTTWLAQIQIIIEKMLKELGNVQACIRNFKKGYLIYREYIVLSNGEQVLYSINLDKRLEFPSRKNKKLKLSYQEVKEFRDHVRRRLVTDIN
jgi:hypothetical protein